MNPTQDKLDQYDYIDDDYFEKAVKKYSKPIGEFFMTFSYLEYELDQSISNIINDQTDQIGYIFLTQIDRMGSKIDIFHKYYKFYEHVASRKQKINILHIVNRLKDVNTFRNNLAHAKWQTIQKNGNVRVKIESENQTGEIVLKNKIITTKDIRAKIREIKKLLNDIENYQENIN